MQNVLSEVRALRPVPTGHAAEWVRDTFWFVPTALLLAGVAWAVLTASADELGVPDGASRGLPVEPSAAENILTVIAGSTLTFVGVVFTITLVALQLASSQLSPRVVRTFVRSPSTRLAFGVFLATFAYAVVMLVLDGGLDTPAAQSRAVTSATVLVAASVGVFVWYVTATMRLFQVAHVITAVADETRDAVDRLHPPAGDHLTADPPVLGPEPYLVRAGRHGVLVGVDRARMVRIAERHGWVVELLAGPGAFVPAGAEVLAVHGSAAAPDDDVLLRCVRLGGSRSMSQDVPFGLRQLVDVAIQALSPALNQPTTAVHVLDRIEDVLLRIAARPLPSGYWLDGTGVVRLVEPPPTWTALTDLAFAEIVVDGGASLQVSRRLLRCFDVLPGVEGWRKELTALVTESHPGTVRALALRPDPVGLG